MSPRLPRITANELMRALRRDGWYQTRQVGSHVVMRNDVKAGRRAVVPAHAGKTMVRAELHGHPLITGEVEVKRADLEYYAAPLRPCTAAFRAGNPSSWSSRSTPSPGASGAGVSLLRRS